MLKRLFTWWNSSTFGTSLTLWRKGAREVGRDAQGNRYFEERGKSLPGSHGGRSRRWVIYHGVAEASRVPPDWHGWLHHVFEEPPGEEGLKRHAWESEHLPNMTGTPLAYRPPGSLARAGGPAEAKPAYEAWSPDDG